MKLSDKLFAFTIGVLLALCVLGIRWQVHRTNEMMEKWNSFSKQEQQELCKTFHWKPLN